MNIKISWNILNNILNRKKSHHPISLKIGSDITSDAKEIANHFNNFFASICANSTTTYSQTLHTPSQNNAFILSNSLFLYPTSSAEISTALSQLKNSYTPGGHDVIPSSILKHISSFISTPLSHFFNFFYETGHFPLILKHAKVIPLYKKGDKKVVSNYQPISLISSISKLFERTLHDRITYFLEENNALNPCQYGFRKKKSVSDALLQTVTSIQNELNNGNSCIALLIDLQKAFDSVNHAILLTKLWNVGIRGIPHQLIASYLSERSQNVLYNGQFSSTLPINVGVPQGSILGPLLFLIFINDLSHFLPFKSILYADDTTILIPGQNNSELFNNSNKCIDTLLSWLSSNKLKLNVDKTTYLYYGKHQHADNLTIKILGTTICRSASTKLLGMFIDDKFSWDKHIKHVYSLLNPWKHIFYNIRHKLTEHSKYLLYHSFIQTHLLQGIELYSNASSNKLNKLKITQNKLIKIIFAHSKFHSTDLLYKSHNIMTLDTLALLKKLKVAYLAIFKGLYHFPSSCLKLSSQLRCGQKFILFHSSNGSRDVLLQIFQCWNQIPSKIRISAERCSFNNFWLSAFPLSNSSS